MSCRIPPLIISFILASVGCTSNFTENDWQKPVPLGQEIRAYRPPNILLSREPKVFPKAQLHG